MRKLALLILLSIIWQSANAGSCTLSASSNSVSAGSLVTLTAIGQTELPKTFTGIHYWCTETERAFNYGYSFPFPYSTSVNANFQCYYSTAGTYKAGAELYYAIEQSFGTEGCNDVSISVFQAAGTPTPGSTPQAFPTPFTTSTKPSPTPIAEPACSLIASPYLLTSAGRVSAFIYYENFYSLVNGNWTANFDCGNGIIAPANCSGDRGSCSAACEYDEPGLFIIKMSSPTSIIRLCGSRLVTARFNATTTTASPTPFYSQLPTLLVCAPGECLWQDECFQKDSQHPFYNQPGNCFYGSCAKGAWKPKSDATPCGERALCCSGECTAPDCLSDAECGGRLYEGKACYSFKCNQAGSCNATCEPESSPTRCGQPGCVTGSNEYCSTLGCSAHSDGRCNCGETSEEFPGEGCEKEPEPIFVDNRSVFSPSKIVSGTQFNITVPYESVFSINASSITCNDAECSCRDLPGEGSIQCTVSNAKQDFDYTLEAVDSKGRPFTTSWRITAAGTVEVGERSPWWLAFIQLVGVFTIVTLASYFAYDNWKRGTPEYKYADTYRRGKHAKQTLQTATIEWAHGRFKDQVYFPLKQKLEKELVESKAALSKTGAAIGEKKAAEIRRKLDGEESIKKGVTPVIDFSTPK